MIWYLFPRTRKFLMRHPVLNIINAIWSAICTVQLIKKLTDSSSYPKTQAYIKGQGILVREDDVEEQFERHMDEVLMNTPPGVEVEFVHPTKGYTIKTARLEAKTIVTEDDPTSLIRALREMHEESGMWEQTVGLEFPKKEDR